MKKTLYTTVISAVFLSLASVVAYSLRFFPQLTLAVCLIVGIALAVANGVFALVVKRKVVANVLQLLFNSVSLGFVLRAWYIFRQFDNALWLMLCVSLACIAYLWVYLALLQIPPFKRNAGLFTLVFVVLSVVVYVLLVVFTKTTFVSTLGLFSIVEIAFFFCMFSATDGIKEFLQKAVVSSFSILIVAVVVVSLVCESADGLEVLECFDFSVGSNKSAHGAKPKTK